MERQADKSVTQGKETMKVCVAGGFGAFLLGLGDLFSGNDDAVLLQISEVAATRSIPGADFPLLVLGVLALLGAGLTWVHQPKLKADAFVRGFSVFAVLGLASPGLPEVEQQEPVPVEVEAAGQPGSDVCTAVTKASVLFTQGAHAADGVIRIDGFSRDTEALVTIRRAGSRGIVRRIEITRPRIRLTEDPGTYVVEVEADGYRRVRFEVVQREGATYRINIPTSAIPTSVQRLTAPHDIEVEELTNDGQRPDAGAPASPMA